MVTLKVPCPSCGQKVSGDESFYGAVVPCPVCSAEIRFPAREESATRGAVAEGSPPTDAGSDPGTHEDDWEATSIPVSRSDPAAALSDSEAPPQASGSHVPSPRHAELAAESSSDAPWNDAVPSPLLGALALVCGILGIVTCVGGILFAPLAIIFGHTALARGRHSPVQPAPGHGLAVAGTAIGYLTLLVLIGTLAAAVFFREEIGSWLPEPG